MTLWIYLFGPMTLTAGQADQVLQRLQVLIALDTLKTMKAGR